ncbi:MAG: UXX-star (seleno)protein family 2 [Chloroflexota bacterium]|nr:UXX-star (seleno)protein family 2 [Chloroflexota bacterium]
MTEQANRTEVVIYTHPDCEFSAAAKYDMEQLGIAFREVDVTVVPGAAEELERLTGGDRVTPVIVEGERVTIGYGGLG